MDFKERKELIQEKFKKLSDDGKIQQKSSRMTSFSDNTFLNNAIEIVKNHVDSKGFTPIPISLNEYKDDIGYNTNGDFNHSRDKMIRLFEIATIIHLDLENKDAFTGLYKSENTNLIRKHLVRNKHLKIVSNADDKNDIYIGLNVSDLISQEE